LHQSIQTVAPIQIIQAMRFLIDNKNQLRAKDVHGIGNHLIEWGIEKKICLFSSKYYRFFYHINKKNV
jgi:hypothetical protein